MDDPHPSYFPSDSPTQIIKPDIDIDTFRSTAKLAALAFALIFLLYSCLRNTRWARKVYTPRVRISCLRYGLINKLFRCIQQGSLLVFRQVG